MIYDTNDAAEQWGKVVLSINDAGSIRFHMKKKLILTHTSCHTHKNQVYVDYRSKCEGLTNKGSEDNIKEYIHDLDR